MKLFRIFKLEEPEEPEKICVVAEHGIKDFAMSIFGSDSVINYTLDEDNGTKVLIYERKDDFYKLHKDNCDVIIKVNDQNVIEIRDQIDYAMGIVYKSYKKNKI